MDHKPGWQTSEFWFALILQILAVVVAMLPGEHPVAQILTAILAAAAGAGYTTGRGLYKGLSARSRSTGLVLVGLLALTAGCASGGSPAGLAMADEIGGNLEAYAANADRTVYGVTDRFEAASLDYVGVEVEIAIRDEAVPGTIATTEARSERRRVLSEPEIFGLLAMHRDELEAAIGLEAANAIDRDLVGQLEDMPVLDQPDAMLRAEWRAIDAVLAVHEAAASSEAGRAALAALRGACLAAAHLDEIEVEAATISTVQPVLPVEAAREIARLHREKIEEVRREADQLRAAWRTARQDYLDAQDLRRRLAERLALEGIQPEQIQGFAEGLARAIERGR